MEVGKLVDILCKGVDGAVSFQRGGNTGTGHHAKLRVVIPTTGGTWEGRGYEKETGPPPMFLL